jgi:hypothetical protein
MLQALKSNRPPPAVRAMLVAEVLVFIGSLAAYVWLALPPAEGTFAWHVVFYVCAGVYPVALNVLHGDWLPDSGIRLDTLKASAREVGVATAVMAAALLVCGAVGGGYHWQGWAHFGDRAALYITWGPIQQYFLQAFTLRRLLQARLPAPAAVGLAAALFGAVHAPNWMLVGVTTASGMTWCILFLRHPNLLTVGLSHGLLALMMYYVLPMSWHAGMGIGGMYLDRVAGMAGG